MSHYYDTNVDSKVKSEEFTFDVKLNELTYKFTSDNGIFSKDGLDRGTKVLLDALDLEPNKRSLDVGTGLGIIGIFLSKEYHHTVDMIDVNDRAIKLASLNAKNNKVIANVYISDFFEKVTGKFDYIISNPPIRIGKKKLYEFYRNAYDFLCDNGEFIIVINKKHGALSTLEELKQIYDEVDVVNKKSGFYVLNCKKRLTI